jgi:hypothetical protein
MDGDGRFLPQKGERLSFAHVRVTYQEGGHGATLVQGWGTSGSGSWGGRTQYCSVAEQRYAGVIVHPPVVYQ